MSNIVISHNEYHARSRLNRERVLVQAQAVTGVIFAIFVVTALE